MFVRLKYADLIGRKVDSVKIFKSVGMQELLRYEGLHEALHQCEFMGDLSALGFGGVSGPEDVGS